MKFILLWCLLILSCEASPTDESDRLSLLQGIKEINTSGQPGGLSVFGPQAFALAAGKAGEKSLLPIAAAARWEKGRVVVFGHDGFLTSVDQLDTGKMLVNAARWAAAGKPAPRVGVYELFNNARVIGYLKANQIEAAELRDRLEDFDVICVNAMQLDQTRSAILEKWVRDGGGLITAVTGWGWVQIRGGNDSSKLATDCPGNQLLKGCGIVFSNSMPGRTLPQSYATGGELALLNATAALDAILDHTAGKVILSPERLSQCGTTVGDALKSLPPDDTVIRPRVNALTGKLNNVPSPSNPVKSTDAVERLILAREVEALRTAEPAAVKIQPGSYFFPGMVGKSAPRLIDHHVTIDLAVPQWHGTGFYAPPGEVIHVTIPPEYAGKGIAIRIGCHTDTLWHLDTWKRAPEISMRKPLKDAVTSVASGFGGLIYIEGPGKTAPLKMEVTISGAVESPRFVLGETNVTDWQKRIRGLETPWGELETKKVILSMPIWLLQKIDDPEALLTFWDRVLDPDADLSSISRERKRPERIVADVQISGGYMHSGYPIMTWLDGSAETAVTLDKLSKGSWGHFHELGHNHQQPDWTFEGTTEVTCNLYSLYVCETLCGIAPGQGHEAMVPEKIRARLEKHLSQPDKFTRWKNEPFLALIMYDQLRAGFGWDTYKKVFAGYRNLPKEQRPKTDDEKRDQWLVRFSRAAGKNLGPFFEAWGIPTSETARSSIADLPSWMPEDWPVVK